jgi:predicted unusual protein kinase regulating ubiquinone biosynthesis (AarF/ABC1/UbiB family)
MTDDAPRDDEANRFSQRLRRYAEVGTNVGGVAAGMATRYVLGLALDREKNAADLTAALGGLKGPLMKVAQLLSTIPDALPPEYAEQLAKLQMHAPPMGWAFVKRRMAAELGADWESKFAHFSHESAASASLGQVHKAQSRNGEPLACKLQYPDMQSAVEADLTQLRMLLSLHKRLDPAIDTSEIAAEISARLREELDYELEARHMALYGLIFDGDPLIRVPCVKPALSTKRLLTMDWMEGGRLLDYKTRGQEERNQITRAMFRAWWYPFSHYGVIHGDPHLGNYSIFEEDGRAGGINLLDYGCMRTFAPRFIQGVIDLYRGLETGDRALIVHAYETWGFTGLSKELIDILNIWAKFIYGPLLDDRVRRIAEGVSPAQYGRREAFTVHKGLKEMGPVRVPREFVFMDRAAIGLGGVFLHLDAELNFYRLFNETIENFSLHSVAAKQADAFEKTGVPLPR